MPNLEKAPVYLLVAVEYYQIPDGVIKIVIYLSAERRIFKLLKGGNPIAVGSVLVGTPKCD